MFPLTYAPSRTPPSSGTSIFPYCCELFGWAEGIFLSVLLHSVFRAGFTAVICSSNRPRSWACGQESGSLSRNVILIWTLWWVRELC